MKRILNLYVIYVLLFICSVTSVSALTYGGCEYTKVANMKSIVSNVNISYDYYIYENEAYFDITLNNIVPEIYFIDSQTGIRYDYNNTINGEITIKGYKSTSGQYKFYSAVSECYGIKLSNRYYNTPEYNAYYNDVLCKENRNYSLCQKWERVNYSYSEFKKMIEEYKNKPVEEEILKDVIYKENLLDIIVKFYTQYYYFILIGIIVVSVIVMILEKRKNSFNLKM